MAEQSTHGGGNRPIDLPLSRRNVLRGAAAGAGLGVFASGGGAIAVALGDDLPRFLSDADRKLLAAVVDRVVPGPPEDLVAGAVQAGCHEAIDALLAAFETDPPRIFAGGPFSDRGGHPVNRFADFLPLDAYEEKAWRLRIEGGPGVDGFQQVYQRGLAALRRSSPTFALLPGLVRDLALRTTSNPDIAALRDLAVTHTLEFFFAAPEYGGNRALRGWQAVDFDGDVQPRGYTREEVEDPEPEMLPLLPPSLGDLLDATVAPLLGNLTDTVSALFTALAGGTAELPRAAAAAAPAFPLATTEGLAGLTAAGDDDGALREALTELLAPLKNAGSEQSRRMAELHRRAAELAAEARGDEAR